MIRTRDDLTKLIVGFERSLKNENDYSTFMLSIAEMFRLDESVVNDGEFSAAIVEAVTELAGLPRPKKAQLKQWRTAFSSAVFERDNHTCVMCGNKPKHGKLDAHHITNRNDMPNGGYVIENGISLCEICHKIAETWHTRQHVPQGWCPLDLYRKIGSTYERALEASRRLNNDVGKTA